MSEKITTGELKHAAEEKRFTMEVDKYTAFVSYVTEDGMHFLTHAEVPYQLRGQGIGEQLVLSVFEYLESHKLSATAICPFIKKVRNEHPNWATIIH